MLPIGRIGFGPPNKPRKPNRKYIGKNTHTMPQPSVYLNDIEREYIEEIAEARETSFSSIIREAVREHAERRQQQAKL